MPIKTVQYQVFEERYFDCPYCGGQVSDYKNTKQKIYNGAKIKCPLCSNIIKIKR